MLSPRREPFPIYYEERKGKGRTQKIKCQKQHVFVLEQRNEKREDQTGSSS